MVEFTNGQKASAIMLLSLLLGSGGTIMLTDQQYDNAYICNVNTAKMGFFDRLSSTGTTGYYKDSSGVEVRKVCTGGVWTKLDDYAKANNIPRELLVNGALQDNNKTSIGIKQEYCTPQGCKPISCYED